MPMTVAITIQIVQSMQLNVILFKNYLSFLTNRHTHTHTLVSDSYGVLSVGDTLNVKQKRIPHNIANIYLNSL